MALVQDVDISARSLAPFAKLFGDAELERVRATAQRLSEALPGGIVWNVNSTARGGGVAELLRSIVAYARGAGIDCRWVVIGGDERFFQLTKRLHNHLHGYANLGEPLLENDRALYERVLEANARELVGLVRPGDAVLLHDPQTAGLVPDLVRSGAIVIWRCHIGSELRTSPVLEGWRFLKPYLEPAHAFVFTRSAYVPDVVDNARVVIIPPTIDPVSPKNQPLDAATTHAILVQAGLVEGPAPEGAQPHFCRTDGSLTVVRRAADVLRLGRAPSYDTPLVVQVSRWDRLKDPIGVIAGFERFAASGTPGTLVLAGPNVTAIADDPEGAAVYEEVVTAWRALPHATRMRVELASLPMTDAEENAAIVNALQRHASVVLQKSLAEGFGLTVAEAMWKARPVIASKVGGIQDQIEHGRSGLLLDDPRDPDELARALQHVLGDPEFGQKLGKQAYERVRWEYLNLRSLYAYGDLITAAATRSKAKSREAAAVLGETRL